MRPPRVALLLFVLGGVTVLLVLPLVAVFAGALAGGPSEALLALSSPEAAAAFRLTLLTAAIAVPLNTICGVAAAWLLACHRFRGRALVVSLIDLPFSVSPVVAGLCHVLLFGAHGWFAPWLSATGIRILFAVPGVVLVTVFVTFPFVAREVMPLLEARGTAAEEAALTLGASGWQVFFRVTLPRIRWALLGGVVQCNARAMGEFGAVSVVSGHIRGLTNTVPLHVETLYNDHDSTGAFAMASTLALLAVVTLVARKVVEHWVPRTPGGRK